MASQNDTKQAFFLPKLKYSFKSEKETDRYVYYDVKFWPHSKPPANEPIFAVAAQKKVIIGRLSAESNAIVTILHELEDEQELRNPESTGLNSCSWCYIEQQRPLLAVAGGSGQLKVIDTIKGERFTTLVGHGHGTINDIATHPLFPWIVATASMDKSVRIWDLRRHNSRHESPTIVICGQATGHSEGVLTLSWHSTGRYLVTGGHDQRICVWTIPDFEDGSSFWQQIAPENRKRSSQEVLMIHFPHFTSSAVHSDFIDCARFFGDLVVSRAAGVAEKKIVLWKITGFDSRKPPPDLRTAPKTEEYLDTRNGFMRTATVDANGVERVEITPELQDQPPYERLLEFETPHSDTFYLRFGLLLPSADYPDIHPTLAFGNGTTELRFWDIERLSLGHAGGLDENKAATTKKRKKRGTAVKVKQKKASERESPSLVRESTVSSTSNISSGPWPGPRQSSTEATSEVSDDLAATNPPFPVPDREKYPIHDPHQPIKCHEKVTLTDLQYKKQNGFLMRAADWSPCGRWCIVAGESGSGTEGWGGFAVLYR